MLGTFYFLLNSLSSYYFGWILRKNKTGRRPNNNSKTLKILIQNVQRHHSVNKWYVQGILTGTAIYGMYE